MPSTPLISVIVPVHDVAGHVGACLRSLRAQTCADFEALVIDDGSHDDSAARAVEVIAGDARFRLIRQAHRGLSAARNAGLDRARGRFIAFVDSDDRVMPDFLTQLVAALEETGGDWAACGLRNVYPDGSGETHSGIHAAPDPDAHPALRRHAFSRWSEVIAHFPSAWNKLYRRALIEGLRFDEGTWFEDHGFFLRAASRTDHLIHLPAPLYLQTRGRAGQITGKDDERVFEQFAVLEDARAIMAAGPHDGAEAAFATLAHRLIAERASVLAAPERRARFARAATRFLSEARIDAAAGDPCWAEEMKGHPPLSVLLRWDGADPEPLRATLGALAQGAVLGQEVVILCPDEAARRRAAALCPAPHMQARVPSADGPFAALRGTIMRLIAPGTRPDPQELQAQARALLASGADLGLIGEAAPEGGRFEPAAALANEIHTAPHLFRRVMALAQGLRLGADMGEDGAFWLAVRLCAWQVVTLPGSAPAQEAPPMPAPRRAAALLAAHDATMAALPETARARLPEGWERRLFLRALWRNWQAAAAWPRTARRRMMITAMLGAVRRGLAGMADPPAGVDPDIPPRLDRLLSPRALLPQGAAPEPSVAGPVQADRESYAPFAPGGAGWLRFCADLGAAPFANLSFLCTDRVTTPFHLSLRREAGLAVLNHRDAGGHWHEEIAHAVPLGPRPVEGVIRFAPDEVEVVLDGVEVAHLRAGARFGGLSAIALLECEGPITLLDVVTSWTGRDLALDARLMLRAPEGTRGLRLGHDGRLLPLVEAAGVPGLLAPLPGWVWADLPDGAALEIRTEEGDGPTLRITREEMRARLETALIHRLEPQDALASLGVLEHLIHGGFAHGLSPDAQARAARIARHFGLAEELDIAAAPPAAPVMSGDTREIRCALARFAEAMAATPAPDPLDVLADLAVPAGARGALCLALGPWFAREAQDGTGFAGYVAAARAAGVMGAPLPADPWGRAALLPLLLAEGVGDVLREVLWRLVPPSQDWLPTEAIAHLARHALSARGLDLTLRESVLYGYMEFVRNRLADPWGRAHCRELTRAAAALLQQRALMSHHLREDFDRFCLQAYGLSRVFWEAVAERGAPETLPPRLAEGYAAFRRIEAARWGAEGRAALSLFEVSGNPDATRIARGLGAPGMSVTRPLELLRAHALPGAAPVPEAVWMALREALPALYPEVSPASQDGPCRALAERIEATLAAPEAAEAGPLLDRLDLMADARVQHLGIGLGLSLLAGIANRPEAGHLDKALRGWLKARLEGLSPEAREGVARAPAVRQGVARLSAAALPATEQLCERLGPAMALPSAAKAPGPAHPLYDTLVVVFTCAPYLETRAPALRTGWLRLLQGLGVPYIFVTGDGDNTLAGDVLRLAAPDDYEGLPQKTLAAIRWVHGQTGFGHMLKIDDDCFLNAPEMLRALNYRRFDYYGRKLVRVPGQMDRRWHQAKSGSAAARRALDKSPEPSSYADGGSGYTLSRHAMAELLDAARSPEGQLLQRISYMEDKLVGDLLALRGIAVAEEGYYTTIRRRARPGGRPVSTWHNGFFASRAMPVQMVHLDSEADQGPALERLSTPMLWPRKIWPGFQQARLGPQSNALDLISSEASAEAAREAPIAVVSVMRNEMFLLPHFLRHYRALGVERFVIADNGSDDGTLEFLAEEPDVTLFSVDTDYRNAAFGVAWQQAMLEALRPGMWSLVADADEFLVWQREPRQSLSALLAEPDFAAAEAVRLFMLDMYPEGPLEHVDFASGNPFAEAGFADRVPFLRSTPMRGPFSDQPSWTSALRHRLIPGSGSELFVAQKIALLRYHPFMRLSAGLHYVGDARLARRELILGHFKYNSDFRRKAQAEVARGQHWGNAEEYRKYLALVSEGRSVIFERGVSLPWHEVPFVAERLG